MRLSLLITFYTICSLAIFSQEYDLNWMHALKNDNGDIMIEISGYEAIVSIQKGHINNEKTIKAIKKKYGIGNILVEYPSGKFSVSNKVIEADLIAKDRPGIKANQICYILENGNGKVDVIYFQTYNQRNPALEEDVIKAYLADGLNKYIENWDTDKISFAGREVELGNACKWMSPHNIHCKGGQISWSIFPSFLEANLDINNKISANGANKQISVLMEEDIDVIFENTSSLAHRAIYRQVSRYGYSNPLVVYYIVQEVRGQYISCVLSNYGYNRNDYELAPLLQQFMSIPELPENAYNQFDIPDYEEITDDEKETLNKEIISWELRASTWLPMGNLSNTFKVAPAFGIYLGIPFNRNMAIDLGFQLAFPIKSKLFDYYYKKTFYDVTEAETIVTISLRYRYQQILAKNIYWTTYIGTGLNSVQTDLKKENSDNDNDKWHTVDTFELFGGVGIRYKKVGCFIEYHYSPYSIANKVRSSFGNSAINTGVFVAF